MRPRILFQGSHRARASRRDTPEQLEVARSIAKELGDVIISRGFELILTNAGSIAADVGLAAVAACERLGVDPRERIRTYPHGPGAESAAGFGMVLQPADRRWREVRTSVVVEADAVIALLGGKGTSDCLQKAVLARKPVFPIPIAGGAARLEWERLRAAKYSNTERGDLDFLSDRSLGQRELAVAVADRIAKLVAPRSPSFSKRIFWSTVTTVGSRTNSHDFWQNSTLSR